MTSGIVCVLSGTLASLRILHRVSVQGVKSLGGHFACLCRGLEFYEVKKIIIIFQKENGNTFTLLSIFIVLVDRTRRGKKMLPDGLA
jgi:hypothetical protein